jgi:hypothetical protein
MVPSQESFTSVPITSDDLTTSPVQKRARPSVSTKVSETSTTNWAVAEFFLVSHMKRSFPKLSNAPTAHLPPVADHYRASACRSLATPCVGRGRCRRFAEEDLQSQVEEQGLGFLRRQGNPRTGRANEPCHRC